MILNSCGACNFSDKCKTGDMGGFMVLILVAFRVSPHGAEPTDAVSSNKCPTDRSCLRWQDHPAIAYEDVRHSSGNAVDEPS